MKINLIPVPPNGWLYNSIVDENGVEIKRIDWCRLKIVRRKEDKCLHQCTTLEKEQWETEHPYVIESI